MALEKVVTEDKIEIVGEFKAVQVRTKTAIIEDGVELSSAYSRKVLSAGDDYSGESAEVQAICSLVHTEAVVAAKSVPPYFFKLVEKIRQLGDDVTKGASTQEREVVTSYKDYMMTEDLGTGNIVIRKRNEGVFYDQDGIVSDEYIIYKPGQADELTKGKKPPAEYDEYTVRPDGDGKLIDSEDGLDSIDEILEEVGDPDSMTIKKASGGIARMLGE